MEVESEVKRTRAAIDCGTNSTRLLIVDEEGRTLHREMTITRLGQGVDSTRRLSAAAIDRTVAVLALYRSVMDQWGTTSARLVATSAVRDAENGGEFLAAAKRTVGVEAELLSGIEEGRLAYAGATAGLEPVRGLDVIVDIGGGSTELVVESHGALSGISLDLGCVRLTERYLRDDPPTAEQLHDAEVFIDSELKRAIQSVPNLASLPDDSRLLGLAGTVSTLASLEMGLETYEFTRLQHAQLTREAVERWCSTLAQEQTGTRMKRVGMAPGREDVIVGGALVLRDVMGGFGFSTLTVSETDILDGLAMSQR